MVFFCIQWFKISVYDGFFLYTMVQNICIRWFSLYTVVQNICIRWFFSVYNGSKYLYTMVFFCIQWFKISVYDGFLFIQWFKISVYDGFFLYTMVQNICIRWFSLSATRIFPLLFTAIPSRPLNSPSL